MSCIEKLALFISVLLAIFLNSTSSFSQDFIPNYERCIPLAPMKIQILYHQLKTSPSIISDFRRNAISLDMAEELRKSKEVQKAVRDWAQKQSRILNQGAREIQPPHDKKKESELREQIEPDINVIAKMIRENIPFVYRHFGHGKTEDIDFDYGSGNAYYELSLRSRL